MNKCVHPEKPYLIGFFRADSHTPIGVTESEANAGRGLSPYGSFACLSTRLTYPGRQVLLL